MAKQVTVVAKCKAKPGMEDMVRNELLAMISPTRLEAGCINYDLHQSLDDPSVFIFYENWKSKADLDAHMATPHFQALAGKAEEIFAGPIDIALAEMISEK